MFCFAHIIEDECCFDQSFPRLKTLRYLDLRTKRQSKKHHVFVFGLNVNENVQHDTGSCFAFEEKQVEVTCWVFCPARKDEKQTFSHFFGVVLWTLHWAKNTRLAKWASTTGGFIEQEFHLKPDIRKSTSCFWNPQEKMRLRATWGKTTWFHQANTLTLMRWKSSCFWSLILDEVFLVLTKFAQWKRGFTDLARRKEQKVK